MSTPTTVTDLHVSPRRWPIWQGAVGTSVKILGRWGKAARVLQVKQGGIIHYIDGSGAYRTETVGDGATLEGQFLAVLSTLGGVAATAHTIAICE